MNKVNQSLNQQTNACVNKQTKRAAKVDETTLLTAKKMLTIPLRHCWTKI